jgi:hypothetical protein
VAWIDELAEALEAPRLDQVEALRRTMPEISSFSGQPEALTQLVARLAALTGRAPDVATPDRLAWWLDALLLQKVVRVPRSKNRTLVPVLFSVLAILLGLIIGRVAAAGVMSLGLVIWAIRAGGSVRERHGDWLRLGELIFDLRHARRVRLDDEWVQLEGHRVQAAVLVELGVVDPPRP